MPESPNNQPPKDLSMETRLLIAFVLMFAVLFASQYLYKSNTGPVKTAPPVTPAQAAQETKPPPPAKVNTAEAATPATPMPGAIQDTAEHEFTVDTALYKVRFSNKGGVVQSWLLKKYLDHSGKPLELVNSAALSKVTPPFALSLKDQAASSALNFGLYQATPAPDGLGVDYEFSDGKNYAKKSFRFGRDSYLTQVATEVKQSGIAVPHLISWRGGFGDNTVLNRVGEQHAVYFDLSNSKLVIKDAKSAKDGVITSNGNYSFAGLDDRFFALAFLPKDNTSVEVQALKDDVPMMRDGKDELVVGAAVGGDAVNKFSVFVGPKDIDILRNVDPKLQQLIDWGYFGVIAKPLFLALHWMNDNYIHSYGWSIVLLTIVINLVLFPLRLTGLKSQRKMSALQPHIKSINERYKGLKLNDPKKQEQNAEIMDLYKKHGVNPAGGCLPMVLQLPILWAIYKVLTVTIELRGAHWLWVTDLSQPETLAIHVLPLIMVATQFFMQQMTPTPGMDPSQAKMMKLMPLMFGFFFYSMSSGLVLYWLTGNLVGIVQQVVINRIVPQPNIEPPKTALVKKRLKG
jgi:YidC/Oxa1 family membrane protein insertase